MSMYEMTWLYVQVHEQQQKTSKSKIDTNTAPLIQPKESVIKILFL